MVPLLLGMKVLRVVDGSALGLYALAYSRFVKAHAVLEARGLMLETVTGEERPSPYLAVADRAVDVMRRFLCEFGLTPSSRSSIRASGGARDELAEFMAKRKGSGA